MTYQFWLGFAAGILGTLLAMALRGHTKHRWKLRGTNHTELAVGCATNVLFSCTNCNEPRTVVIHGKWSTEEIKGEVKRDEFARQMGIQL